MLSTKVKKALLIVLAIVLCLWLLWLWVSNYTRTRSLFSVLEEVHPDWEQAVFVGVHTIPTGVGSFTLDLPEVKEQMVQALQNCPVKRRLADVVAYRGNSFENFSLDFTGVERSLYGKAYFFGGNGCIQLSAEDGSGIQVYRGVGEDFDFYSFFLALAEEHGTVEPEEQAE